MARSRQYRTRVACVVFMFGFLKTALLAAMVSLAPAAMAMLPVPEENLRE
jgi:hypothetical protein